jgi:ACS family hexuronate transporter-like MFS transporter
LSDVLVRRGWQPAKARQALMLFAACLMPLSLLAVRTEHVWVAVALIGLLFAAQTCWMANQLSLISESVSRQNVATMLSLSALGGSIGGMVSNTLVGRAVASVGYVPVFTGFGFLHLIAFGALMLGWRWSQARAARLGVR